LIDTACSSESSAADSIGAHQKRDSIGNILLRSWDNLFSFPDDCGGWYSTALVEANKLLETREYAAIITTSYPVTSHLVGAKLKKDWETPWIADFRDLWTQNPYYNLAKPRHVIDTMIEKDRLREADALSTVSEPMADALRSLHKNKTVVCIPNGFDPEDKVGVTTPDLKFRITYTGSLYWGRRDPSLLFAAIEQLIRERKIAASDIVIEFYGRDSRSLIDRGDLGQIVRLHDEIPRDEAMKAQKSAQVLLLLTWNDPREVGVYTGKLFEYLAAGRPILSIGPPSSVVDKLLRETHAGVHVSDLAGAKEAIMRFYNEFKANGSVRYDADESELDRFSQIRMASRFSELLDTISASKS